MHGVWLTIGKYFWISLLFVTGIWSLGALYYTIGWHGWLRISGMAVIGGLMIVLLVLAIRGSWLSALDLTILELLVLYHFLLLTPQEVFHSTCWQQPWERRPYITFDGSRALIHNIRDFNYHTENKYDVRYISMTVDLDKVTHVDLAVSHWNGLTSIAHTMLTFVFADGQYLAFSMETRLPEGVEQNAVAGLYKQYELLPIIATERDLYQLRTTYRQEELYLYRTNATPEQARLILTKLLVSINEQYFDPQFYNSLTHNCTTSLAPMLRWIDPSFSGDIRLLFNGYSDELLFELGYLAHHEGETFAQLKARRKANLYIGLKGDYSAIIRTDL